jgi:phosphatidylglycerol:prolipoprotein diacylglycerol transferase
MPTRYWVDDLSPYLVQFSEHIGIRWYGLSYLAGFLVAGWLFGRYARRGRTTIPADDVWNGLLLALMAGVMIGGRVGSYFLYGAWRNFRNDPIEILRPWEGGMASHGGFVGVALALWWYARWRRITFVHIGDVVASTVPAGLFFGRLANFINGELWGRVTYVKWAVIFPRSMPNTPLERVFPRHPSQLYEAALEGLLLLAYLQWRFWKTDVVRTRPGRLAGEFLIGYALVRAFGEQFREPDAGVSLIFGLTRGTFYSIFLFMAGLILWLRRPAAPVSE